MARSLPRPTPSRPRRSAADAALIRLAGPAGTPPDPAVLHDLVSAGLAEAGLPGRGPCPTQAGHARLKRLAAVEAGVPPWLAQHRPVRPAHASEAGPGAAGALVDDAESPLAWLHRRKDKRAGP